MRLATIQLENGQIHAAIAASDGTFCPVGALVPALPDSVLGIIDAGEEGLALLREAIAAGRGASSALSPSRVKVLAPIPRPRRNVVCVGYNYQRHFDEARTLRGSQAPQMIPNWVTFFSKNPATVVGPDEPVLHPSPHSEQPDWEVELAVIISRPGRDIPESHAMAYVFGYTVANDISVRDVQRRHGGQFFKGKNFDTHLPLGPVIVTPDEIQDPHDLRLVTRVNGVVKQDSSTRHMVFRIPRIIAELSAGMSIEPGDIISTGTPEGSGFARTPPEYLAVGDQVEVEIERIGVLRNRVVARER